MLCARFGSQNHLRGILGAVQRTTHDAVALGSRVLLLWGYGVGDQRCFIAIPEAPARVAVPRTSWAGAGRPALSPQHVHGCRANLPRKVLNFCPLLPSSRPSQTCASYREIAIFAFPETAPQVQQSNSRTASRCYWWQCTHHRRERARINKGAFRMVASPKNGLGHRGGQLRTEPTHAPYSVSGAAT